MNDEALKCFVSIVIITPVKDKDYIANALQHPIYLNMQD